MSNYTSQPITLAPVTSSINLPLIQQVLQVKQGTYNQVDANIQSGISAIENLKLLRPQDTEYLNTKLQGMTASLDNLQDKDLSNPNVASTYYTSIKSVAQDPFIVEARANTIKYQQFQGMMQDIQKKNPDKFHQINYQFAVDKAGLNEYMEGKTNSLGNFSYHNYSDTNKNLLDRLKTLKDLKGDRTIEILGTGENGVALGEKVIKKLSGLTPQEIIDYVPGMLTSEDDMQMRINGWWTGKQDPNGVNSNFSSYVQNKTEEYDSNIQFLKSTVDNKQHSEEKRQEARQKLSALQSQKEQFLKNTPTATLEEKGYFLTKNDYVKSIANVAGSDWSTSYELDDNYYAKQNLAIKVEELNIKKDALKLKQDEAKGIFSPDGISVSPITGALAEEIDAVAQVAENFEATQNQLTSTIQSVYNSSKVEDSVKKNYDSAMMAMGYKPNGEVLNPAKQPTLDKATAMGRAYDESKMYLSDATSAAEIVRLKTLSDNAATDYQNSLGTASKDKFNENPDKYVNQFIGKIQALEREDDGFITGLFGIGGASERVQALTQEARNFIKEVGGEKNLKNIGSNPQKLEKFRKITEKLANEREYDLNFRLGNITFSSEVQQRANELLKSNTARASFGSANQVTFSNPKQVQQIVSLIPTTEENRPFDPKEKLTVYQRMVGGQPTLVVEQNVGFDEKNSSIKKSTVVLTPQMAGYEYLKRTLDSNEDSRGLSAENAKGIIPISKVPAYLKDDKKYTPKTADYLLNNTPPSYIGRAFYANPANYLTKNTTEESYQNVLKSRYSAEQISQITNHISNRLSNYKIDLEPLDGEWYMSLEDKETGADYRGGKIGQRNLETPFLNIVQNYPHTVVLDFFLKELLTDKTAYNRIINNGRE